MPETSEKQGILPSPVVQKGTFHEIVTFGSSTLQRSFSYDHFWTPGKDGNGTAITRVVLSSQQVPSEPSKKRKRLTYNKKSSHRKKQKSAKSSSISYIMHIIFWSASIGSALYMYYFKKELGENLIWPMGTVEVELKNSLIGQNVAIEKLVNAVDLVLKRQVPAAIILTGPVGVGKTTATNILMKNFPWQHQSRLVRANELSNHSWLHLTRNPVWTLLVVDNCCENPSQIFDNLDHMLDIAKQEGTKLLIVVVVTNRKETESENFATLFQKSNANFVNIEFEPLTRENVRECILRRLKNQGLPIVEKILSDVVGSQMKYADEFGGHPGCKLIEARVAEYEDEYRRAVELNEL